MRLVEFLILLLEAHAQTLQRLAAVFGEDELIEILENAAEGANYTAPSSQKILQFHPDWMEQARAGEDTSLAYTELEGAVREMGLAPMLEFHLWAYPHYRAFIEGPINLNSRIRGGGSNAGVALVEEALSQANAWIRALPLPPAASAQAERAAEVAWLRFRANALRKIGRRPMGPVY